MDKLRFLDDLQARVTALLQDTPAAELQRSLKALLAQQFARMELVTRDDLDVQARVLARSREKLEALEARVAALEGPASADPGSSEKPAV
jgi:hypothetical protein